jgi:predicted Zn finger-like uncharacterized protein
MDLGEGMGPGANPRYKAALAVPMATLIICPVCDTRYETKAVFPPEGRKVRCSKCSHVWQAMPVTAPPEPAVQTAPPPQPRPAPAVQSPPPPPPPQPAAPAVNVAMRGFAGISVPTPEPRIAPVEQESELAAQVARINAEAMAEAPVAPPPEKRGGIFARLAGRSAAAPPPPDAGMGEASMGESGLAETGMPDASVGDGAMADASMGDASMGDAGMSDAELGIDPALAAQAFPEELGPRRVLSVVTLGWLVLALVVASVIGTLAFAPSTVMSVLPGAARLYALFGVPVGAHGLAFEGVRYGWTNDGGQTVLEVQGDVVNTTAGTVDVPTVVIALRDESGSEISEWTTEIGTDELAGGEHAPFLRQIPSPPSNVRSVKVRFAKAE